jgi:hypothetical protein
MVFEGVSTEATIGVASSWGSEEFGHPQANNLWRIDSLNGSFALASAPVGVSMEPEIPPNGVTAGSNFAGGSDDFSHIVFSSTRRLLEQVPPDTGQLNSVYLYEWHNGELRPASILPESKGGGFTVSVLGYASPYSTLSQYPGQSAVSADGSRIFFSDTLSPSEFQRELYVREVDVGMMGGRRTVHVSESERTDCAGDPTCGGDGVANPTPDPDTPTAALFQSASANADGPAIFTSITKLTDEATASISGGFGPLAGSDTCAFLRCGLYWWDPTKPSGERIVDLTADDPHGGGVLGVAGASDDSSRVYFVGIGSLATGAVDGQPNLYLWEQGEGIQHIATLDSANDGGLAADEGVWSHQITGGDPAGTHSFGGGVRVTQDGRFIVFRSRARLTGYDTNGRWQLYRFDAINHSLICVSCNPLTSATTGDAFLKRDVQTAARSPWLSRNVSPNGDVVFDSAESLVPKDTNGQIDVYEWADAHLKLLSSGIDPDDSTFVDASESGEDVFFTTRARLVESDEDELVDLYDARVGGGFKQTPLKSDCMGDTCQGAFAPPPAVGGLVSESVHSDTNVRPKKAVGRRVKCRKGLAKKRVRGRARCVKKRAKKTSRHEYVRRSR